MLFILKLVLHFGCTRICVYTQVIDFWRCHIKTLTRNFWRFGVGFAVSLDLIAFRRSLKRAARMCPARGASERVRQKCISVCSFCACSDDWLINTAAWEKHTQKQSALTNRREQYTATRFSLRIPGASAAATMWSMSQSKKGCRSILIIENCCAPPSMQQ